MRIHEPSTLSELEQVARGLASRGARVVLLAGGDGTFMRCLSALGTTFDPRSLPIVGIVPAGTVGTVARNLGFAGMTIRTLVSAACSPAVSGAPQPTLRVRDGSSTERVGFIFGAGLVTRFFDLYHRSARPGLVTASTLAARVFAGSLFGSRLAAHVLSPVPSMLAIDGLVREGRGWSLVVASVLRDLGLHFLVTYRAGSEARRFHVVASGLPPSELGRQMPRVIAGRGLLGQPHVDALAGSLQLSFEAGEDGYVLDGDVFRASSVTVEAGPIVPILRVR